MVTSDAAPKKGKKRPRSGDFQIPQPDGSLQIIPAFRKKKIKKKQNSQQDHTVRLSDCPAETLNQGEAVLKRKKKTKKRPRGSQDTQDFDLEGSSAQRSRLAPLDEVQEDALDGDVESTARDEVPALEPTYKNVRFNMAFFNANSNLLHLGFSRF